MGESFSKMGEKGHCGKAVSLLIRFSECPPGKQKGYEERVIKVGIAATRRKEARVAGGSLKV